MSERIFPVIACHDNLTGYRSIGIEQNVDVAIRGFSASVMRGLESGEDSEFYCDLSLHHIGNLDLDSGQLYDVVPVVLCRGSVIVSQFNVNSKRSCDCSEALPLKDGESCDN